MSFKNLPKEKTRSIRKPVGFEKKEMEGYFMISKQDASLIIINKLSGTQIRLWLYLRTIDSFSNTTLHEEKAYYKIPNSTEIALKIGANTETVEKDLRKLDAIKLLPEGIILKQSNRTETERKIRDRLKLELGGLTEVIIPVGRIDLLTETEVIEVKHISEWKSAMGQVLAYSNFYPNHYKRLHLFSTEEQSEQLITIESTCLPFEVLVTFEKI